MNLSTLDIRHSTLDIPELPPFTLSPSLPFDQGKAYTQLKT